MHLVPAGAAPRPARAGRSSTAATSLRVVITGGEAVPAVLPDSFYERLPGASLLNRYGPTETTIVGHLLALRARTSRPRIAADRPAHGERPGLPARRRPPAGAGGGPGRDLSSAASASARGYLGRPDLTAERFVPDPFGGEAGARLYRTGDLARYRAGRRDRVPGPRRPPGEDPRLPHRAGGDRGGARPPSRRCARRRWSAARTAPDRQPGRLSGGLACRATAGRRPSCAGFLPERLPDYMVPAAFVVAGGPAADAQRQGGPQGAAGAAAAGAGAAASEAPRTPVEELLAGDLGEVLRRSSGSARTDDFFELGGHSLLATQVVSRVRRGASGSSCRCAQLFEAPDGGRAGGAGRAAMPAGAVPAAPPIVPVPREGGPAALLRPGAALVPRPARARRARSTTCRWRCRLRGRARRSRPCAGALTEVVRRHEALRTVLRRARTARPVAGDRIRALPARRCRWSTSRRLPARTAARRTGSGAPTEAGRPVRPRARAAAARRCCCAWRRRSTSLAADPAPHRLATAGRWACWCARSARSTRRSLAGAAVAAAGAAGPVRGLRGLAARLAARRGPGGAARLLAAAARGRCRRSWSCPPTGRGRRCRASAAGGAGCACRPRWRGPARRCAGREGRRSFMVLLAAFQALLHRYSRPGRPRGGLAGRRPRPAGDRGADRLLRQHPGAARRPRGQTPASASCSAGRGRRRSPPTRTRTCRSRSWSRSWRRSAT